MKNDTVRIYDNGGKTVDRYTVIFMDQFYTDSDAHRAPFRRLHDALGMSAEPFAPHGIGQHTSGMPGSHLGKRITFDELPEDCQRMLARERDDIFVWYSSGCGRIEFQMTIAQARSVSHPGYCNADVLALSRVPAIKRALAKIDLDVLRAELQGYGAWNEVELTDHAQNLQRVLWSAGNEIAERLA